MASVDYRLGVTPSQLKRTSRRATLDFKTLPILPNSFPYNEMLLNGTLKLGEFGVKTQNWNWNYRGPVLLYTSTSTALAACRAYGFNPKIVERQVIVGIGDLVEVRKLKLLTEWKKLFLQFNNVTSKEARNFFKPNGSQYIEPLPIGFFFKNLQRFKTYVPFKPKRGPVRLFETPISTVAKALKEIGIDPRSLIN